MKTTYGLPQKREKVLDILKLAFINNNLEESEYESRVSQALDAKCVEDLRTVLYDFPKNMKEEIFEDQPTKTPDADSHFSVSNSSQMDVFSEGNERFNAFFSEKNHEISVMNHSLSFQSFMAEHNIDMRKAMIYGEELYFSISCHVGSTTLDLRNENLDGKNIRIKVDCLFGNIKIYIPAGGRINNKADMLLGEFSVRNKKKSWLNKIMGKEEAPPQEANFMLNIVGSCAFAELIIIY